MLPSDGPEHKSRRLNSGAVAGSCNLANSSNSAAAYNNSNSNSNNTNNYSLPGAGSAMNNSARAHSRRADGPRAARTSRDFADFLREYIDSSERSGQLDFDDNETNSSADRTNSATDYDGSRGPSSVGGDTDSTRTMPGEPSSVNDDGTLHRRSRRTFRGVHWNPTRGCYVARLWRNGRCEILGEFSTEARAALAWDVKAESYFGPNFAEFNFPSEEDRARLWMAFTRQISFGDSPNNTPSSSSSGGNSSSSDGQNNSNESNDDNGDDEDDDDDDDVDGDGDQDRIVNAKPHQGR
mmetsp:Transcript_10561/g.17241  ORF Transcript_10561/g.17241 Transcript_10561/m.17241 type:complete len:295 (+) Transcript_10561:410-1294(+)